MSKVHLFALDNDEIKLQFDECFRKDGFDFIWDRDTIRHIEVNNPDSWRQILIWCSSEKIGDAIVYLDMNFMQKSYYLRQQVGFSDFYNRIIEAIDGDEELISDFENYTGYFLMANLLKNNSFSGLISIASSHSMGSTLFRFEEILKNQCNVFNENVQLVVPLNTNNSLSDVSPKLQNVFKRRVLGAIGMYCERFGSLLARVHPTESRSWFTKAAPCIKHNWDTGADRVPLDKRDEAKGIIRAYLRSVLTFDPPTEWTDATKIDNLWDCLKGLVGSHAQVYNGADGKSPSLHAIAIVLVGLLAKDLGKEKAQELANAIQFNVDCAKYALISGLEVPRGTSRDVFLRLFGENSFFKMVCYDKKTEQINVESISLIYDNPGVLKISLASSIALGIEKKTKS